MKHLLLAILLVHALEAGADQIGPLPDKSGQVFDMLRQRYPDVSIESVSLSAHLPGYYEVLTEGGLVYADSRGERLITGYVTDTLSQENLTAKRLTELRAVDFASLPLDLAIRDVRGDGSRKLVVFSDPDCPFCQRLERQIEALDNVTLYTFLYPIETLHPGAQEKAVRVWCAADRAQVWADWMRRKVEPAAATCEDDPVERLLELGARLRINATPTMFLEDGRRLEGALTIADLEDAFAAPGQTQ